MGVNYRRLAEQLAYEGFPLVSVCTVGRIARSLHLPARRRDYLSPAQFASSRGQATAILQQEMTSTNYGQGYRFFYQRLQSHHRIHVARDEVGGMMRRLDPQGVQERQRRRLVRRTYFAAGPDFVWHCDGEDKLKRFGIYLHGGIDGFSRKVVWLRASASNKSPAVVGRYFLEACLENQVCPRFLRTDRGVENGRIGVFVDNLSERGRHLYGRSVHNQRIEQLWSHVLNKVTRWTELFLGLLEQVGLSLDSDRVVCLIQFCFMDMVDEDFCQFANVKNFNYISVRANSGGVRGRPYYLYRGGGYGCYGTSLAGVDPDLFRAMYSDTEEAKMCLDPDLFDWLEDSRILLGKPVPQNQREASDLFLALGVALRPHLVP